MGVHVDEPPRQRRLRPGQLALVGVLRQDHHSLKAINIYLNLPPNENFRESAPNLFAELSVPLEGRALRLLELVGEQDLQEVLVLLKVDNIRDHT